jgi:hypothetical protein
MNLQSTPVAPRSNTMASISLISAIIGWGIVLFALIFGLITFGVGGICLCLAPVSWLVAVVTGHTARNQIKQTGESGDGQATKGIILGYIGLALVAIVLAIGLLFALGAFLYSIGLIPHRY